VKTGSGETIPAPAAAAKSTRNAAEEPPVDFLSKAR